MVQCPCLLLNATFLLLEKHLWDGIVISNPWSIVYPANRSVYIPNSAKD